MKKLLLVFVLLLLTACQDDVELSATAKLAQQYVESFGYEVVSFESEESYELGTSDYDKELWGVQETDLSAYVSKPLTQVRFIVTNHPLDAQSSENETFVTVFLDKNSVIAATSIPHDKALMGGTYSIDGLTAEEVQLDYNAWSATWDANYGGE